MVVSVGVQQTAPSAPDLLLPLLFELAKVKLGHFENCLDFLQTHPTLDFRECADIFWWQARTTFERLLKSNYDIAEWRVAWAFVHQCVQQYSILSLAADCGIENGKTYVRR